MWSVLRLSDLQCSVLFHVNCHFGPPVADEGWDKSSALYSGGHRGHRQAELGQMKQPLSYKQTHLFQQQQRC